LVETVTCLYEKTVTVTVTQANSVTFTPIPPICSGGELSALPTTSLEGITGTWSPALNNTVTTTYIFTPDSGQCATIATLEIVVNQDQIEPTFTAVSPICSGDALSALPTTSLEGITGTWSPALNNTATTTYTFTPDNGQCATPATLEIVVNERTTPTFTAIPTICVGGNATLPATSLEGIPGTWSPAFNNAATTTYTFTPAAGQCATTATLTITVGEPVVPTFDPIDTVVCSGDAIAALPTTSINGIAGTWSPALNNTATTTYTFTPTVGQCATVVSITINVTPLPEFTITQGCMDSDYTLAAVDSNLSNPSYAWFDASNNAIGSEQTVVVTASGTYKLVITQDGCSTEELVDVASALCTFDIQKGISANNDGYNDNFELSTLGVKELKIFNRYGMKVYSKGNYTNEWYGQSDKGDELPDGTYYYVIDRNTGATVTGWIYINREQ
jgi:gliding motility-associated-like protein